MTSTAADGAHEDALPSEVPRDEDHLATPRDLRAARLASALEGRTGHRDPEHIADQLTRIEDHR